MTDRTTINIKKEIREMLNKLRVHRRDTYDDIIERELNKAKIKNKVRKK